MSQVEEAKRRKGGRARVNKLVEGKRVLIV